VATVGWLTRLLPRNSIDLWVPLCAAVPAPAPWARARRVVTNSRLHASRGRFVAVVAGADLVCVPVWLWACVCACVRVPGFAAVRPASVCCASLRKTTLKRWSA
jgi:hypothetical protein